MSVPVLPPVPDSSEVRRELDLILSSTVFRGSKRCQDFLRYVATKSLEGESSTLKERILAVEVFGRSGASDLAEDSIVRVGAREVRKRLAQYYVTDGAHDQVRIDLPAGSYVPVFHYHLDEPERIGLAFSTVSQPEIHAAAPLQVAHRRRLRPVVFLIAAIVLALAAGLAFALRHFERAADPFQTFWNPVLNAGNPVLIVLPHPIVYHPSSRANALDRERHGDSLLPLQRSIDVPPQMLDGSDFIPVLNQYVGWGDALAAIRLTSLIQRYGRPPRFRLASRVEFNDLRESTPLLIGAFTNRWTIEMTRNMRFRFVLKDGKPAIADTRKGHLWSVQKLNDGRSSEDYVLICRLPHSATGDFMMVGAGINMSGTEEAGRILTDPKALDSILHQLPKGWESNNLQLVLHMEVIGDAPAMPQVVAMQIWK